MDNNIYIALSRQMALFRDMEITAGNIANANTTGYTSEHLVFESYLKKDINLGERNPMAFAHDIASYRNTQNGPLNTTNNPLDMAIQGNGYFAVQSPNGVRYTRAGNFQIAGDGTLSTPDGYAVLDNSNQPIVLPEDAVSVEVGEVGNLKVNGEDFTTIGIVQFANEQLLERLNGSVFASEVTPEAAEEGTVRVVQGALEGSNVQPVMEMTHMIAVSRGVTETAKFVEIMYDLQRKTANTYAQQA